MARLLHHLATAACSIGFARRSVFGERILPTSHQQFDGIRQMLAVDVMVTARHANLVGFNHHVRMTTALGWLEPVTCNLEPQAKWIAEINRIHKASVHRAGMRNPTRVQTFRHLPKTGLADVERKMMQRTCRLWYVRGIGLAFFIGEDRDQSAIARIEIQVPLVRIIEVRLVEDEWHSQNALPEIDRRLAVGTDNRDVMDALGLDLPDRLGF